MVLSMLSPQRQYIVGRRLLGSTVALVGDSGIGATVEEGEGGFDADESLSLSLRESDKSHSSSDITREIARYEQSESDSISDLFESSDAELVP